MAVSVSARGRGRAREAAIERRAQPRRAPRRAAALARDRRARGARRRRERVARRRGGGARGDRAPRRDRASDRPRSRPKHVGGGAREEVRGGGGETVLQEAATMAGACVSISAGPPRPAALSQRGRDEVSGSETGIASHNYGAGADARSHSPRLARDDDGRFRPDVALGAAERRGDAREGARRSPPTRFLPHARLREEFPPARGGSARSGSIPPPPPPPRVVVFRTLRPSASLVLSIPPAPHHAPPPLVDSSGPRR